MTKIKGILTRNDDYSSIIPVSSNHQQMYEFRRQKLTTTISPHTQGA